MSLAGYSDLQGRSAFQPVIVEQNGRWIAYVGHHFGGRSMNPLTGKIEANGTSILDVTDPRRPRYLHHLATASAATMVGGEGSGAQMVQVCAGKDLPKGDRAASSTCCAPQAGARDVGRHHAGKPGPHHYGGRQAQVHARAVVGVR